MNELLLKGRRQNKVRQVDPKHTLMSIVGMSAGFFIFRPVAEIIFSLSPEEAETFAAERAVHIADLILHGILKS